VRHHCYSAGTAKNFSPLSHRIDGSDALPGFLDGAPANMFGGGRLLFEFGEQ
jgi:hypothetical protein